MTQPIVSIKQGKILGKISKNINNKPFFTFHGIPFAKPPIGELRFKPPQPPEPWFGIRDATKEEHECIVKSSNRIIGSEDCLYLNVYTPEIASKILRPVIFWIHGGAFKIGSSKTKMYGPEYLLTEDVVLVTTNYRLGILGFLQLQDSSLGVPGNAALRDIVIGLKWVQNNIHKFCGDPKNVTIAGQSAGGAAVHYLVLSHLTQGLFHKAIAQSGCALHSFAQGRDDIISHISSLLHKQDTSEKEILDHLISSPIEDLLDLSEKVEKSCDALKDSALRLPFGPLIEKPSPYAFISKEPIEIIKEGNYNHVPMIFGYTSREGMFIEIKFRPAKASMPLDFEDFVPYTLKLKRGSEKSKMVAQRMKEFYYNQPNSENDIENFYLLHGDNCFIRDIIFSAELHSKINKWPVFLYRMSIETDLNIYKTKYKVTNRGVCHGDDIGYLFKTKNSPTLKENTLEEISVKRFVKYWTSFAKHGNPNLNEYFHPQWKSVAAKKLHFIDIGKELTVATNPEGNRMQFWKDIFLWDSLIDQVKSHL